MPAFKGVKIGDLDFSTLVKNQEYKVVIGNSIINQTTSIFDGEKFDKENITNIFVEITE